MNEMFEAVAENIKDLLHNKKWAKLKIILEDMNEQDIAELFRSSVNVILL